MPQTYTVAQANALLPELTRLLEDMRSSGQQLASLQTKVGETKTKIKSNGHHNPTEDVMTSSIIRRLEEQLRQGVTQLAEWEIQLKDLGIGLVDFPAQRQGRTVFLCWQLGEPEVAFWHDTSTGFAGRQPLDDLIQ